MSVLTDLSPLDFLHDARCCSFTWDCSDPATRHVRLMVRVDEDAEYEPWRGQAITVTISEVVMCRLVGWGYQIGEETIDSYRQQVSAEFESECHRLSKLGITIPPLLFTLVLGSGSNIEFACQGVSVESGRKGTA